MATAKWLALLAIPACLTVCAVPSEYGENREVVRIQLVASRDNAGEIATVFLTPLKQDETSLSFVIGGVSNRVTRPLRLFTYIYSGSCATPAAQPTFDMNQTVVPHLDTPFGPWRLSKKVPISLTALLAGQYAVVIRAGPKDGSIDLFCGDIKNAR